MISNFFSTLARRLWRNRLFTALNIVGLSVCICVAWIIFRMVSYEYSFDKKIPDAENIYQVISKSSEPDEPENREFAGISRPVYRVLKNDIPGSDMVVPMFYKYENKATVVKASDKPREFGDGDIMLVATTQDYFAMLGYNWLAGNAATALRKPSDIVLTDKKAAEYFPGEKAAEVMGRVITFDDSIARSVSGVVADLNFPNSFSDESQQFIALSKEDLTDDNWGSKNSNYLLWIKPQKNVKPEQLMAQLNAIDFQHNQEDFEKYKFKSWYEVIPLKEKHFQPQLAAQTRAANKTVLNGLMITGAFLLLLACINYINLSTAMLPARAREIGIRKTLGSSARSVIFRFMGETLVVTMLAAALSFGLTVFATKAFADFLPPGMLAYSNYGLMVIFLVALILLTSVFSGIYPAYLSSRVKTVNVLKGVSQMQVGSSGFSLRKGLIIFQFLIAQIFIIGSIVIHQQLKFALTMDLGFNKNGIITVAIPHQIANDPAYKHSALVLKNELIKNTGFEDVSLGDRPMDNRIIGNIYVRYDGDKKIQQQVNMKFGDTDYLQVYQMKLLAGRNFAASDTIKEMIINEQALKAFGFSSADEALGQLLVSPVNKKQYPIVGVVRDFHQFGAQSTIDPAVITTSKKHASYILNVRLPGDVSKWRSAINTLEAEWKNVYGSVPFTYSFYDETVKKFYTEEQKTQTLAATATGIAILISCLGLFGLATLTAFQRTKEIGIRKVLGASVSGIAALLSKEFLTLVGISILIASPIAWWMMHDWLQDFAYRIEIKWWMFLVAAVTACSIALATVSYQAIRAARANPVDSLRTE